jgi:alpha-glucosidase (family GH31 glycosyl hydrolase)
MTKWFLPIALLLVAHSFGSLCAQEVFRASLKRDDLVFVETSLGLYRFSAFGQYGVDVHFTENANIFNRNSLSTLDVQGKFSNTLENELEIVLERGAMKVQIVKSPFEINYFFRDKRFLQQEAIQKESHAVHWTFNISEREILYGGGARALGMNRRGNKLELYNRAHYGYEERSELMNFSMPIVLGSSGFLLHFDNTSKGYLDLDSEGLNKIKYDAVSGEKRYQIMANNDRYALLSDFTTLTGRQALPPIWALGNFASRFGYRSARQVLEIVEKYERLKVPLDAVVIDLYWFGKTIQGTMGNLAFDLDSFPDPKFFLETLHHKKIQPIVITEPFILTTSKRWKEAVDRDILCKDSLGQVYTFDFYFGNTGLIDVFNPQAQDWFWNIYQELHELGVRGVWGDLGEPEVHPSALRHFNGLTADDLHNAYGHQWAKLIFEGYQKHFPEERLFNLMRAGAPGSQRYGMIPWSGDVNRTWGGLKSQPEIALQMGMQGMAYMHSDLGGFAGDYNDDELYERWLQYGVFQPIFRPHAQEEVPSEPVLKNAETQRITRDAINLRYSLLPYNYNLALENAQTGKPLMRSLFFEVSDDSIAEVCSDTYFWGRDFLISPILEKGAKTKTVTFPPKTKWVDFYTHEFIENNSSQSKPIAVPTNRNWIPTFVRAGAIVPMIEPIQNTSEYKPENIHFKIFLYPDIKSGYLELRNDNFLPEVHPEYRTWKTICRYEIRGKRMRISFTDENGKQVDSYQNAVRIVGRHKPCKVWVNGKRVKRL